jgi:hypothetical protein
MQWKFTEWKLDERIFDFINKNWVLNLIRIREPTKNKFVFQQLKYDTPECDHDYETQCHKVLLILQFVDIWVSCL